MWIGTSSRALSRSNSISVGYRRQKGMWEGQKSNCEYFEQCMEGYQDTLEIKNLIFKIMDCLVTWMRYHIGPCLYES